MFPQVTGEDLNIVRPMMVTMLGMMNEDCLHRPRLPGHALAVPLVGLMLQNPVPPIRGTCVLVAIAGHREMVQMLQLLQRSGLAKLPLLCLCTISASQQHLQGTSVTINNYFNRVLQFLQQYTLVFTIFGESTFKHLLFILISNKL